MCIYFMCYIICVKFDTVLLTGRGLLRLRTLYITVFWYGKMNNAICVNVC